MSAPSRMHLLGPPGAGITTLGRALAGSLGYDFLDIDDICWFTTDPLPYKRKRNPDHCRALLAEWLDSHDAWIISGALCGWGDVFTHRFEVIVYGYLPMETRLERIDRREKERYGGERLAPGGDLHEIYLKFSAWAAQYDTATNTRRSKVFEEKWLESMSCPVIRMDMQHSTENLVSMVRQACNL
jgi:adenylate kinase family enzyme